MRSLRLLPPLTLFSIVSFLGITTLIPSTSLSAPTFTTLQPGQFRNIEQDLRINVVFVGFEQGSGAQEIDPAALTAQLSHTYRTVGRARRFNGYPNFVGVDFTYNYNFVYADFAFEDAFFGYLTSVAAPAPRTVYQDAYNAQDVNVVEIGQHHVIDAPSVEGWLASHAGAMLGINTTEYTVFFINWYGRPDFKFHAYRKTDEPDSDTAFNHGLLRQSRNLIAWGGTTPDDEESGLGSLHRIWFYDLSAGPESWTVNWNVDDVEVETFPDGVLDYRMPPVWEYGNMSGYRPFDDLSGDLGKVLRYVAIDMLFTTSPLYSPALSPPKLPANIRMDVTIYEGDPLATGDDYVSPTMLTREVGELQPVNHFTTGVTERPLANRAGAAYDSFFRSLFPPFFGMSIYGNRFFADGFFDIYLYNQDHLIRTLDGEGDYKIPIFLYNTVPEKAPLGILGFADDNKIDGTQTLTNIFANSFYRGAGFGATDTTIHEVGHHLGLSHPHDGYDFELNQDIGGVDGAFFFTWSGDESNSVMNYLFINNDFSQFDRDNMNRYLTAIYINHANAILPRLLASSRAGEISGPLIIADAQASAALNAYSAMNYSAAASNAKEAYENVLNAADQINVHIEPNGWPSDYRSNGRNTRFIDTVDGYRLDQP